MKAVVGLGNPGPRYDDTRHNVGWWVCDRLAFDWKLDGFRREGPALRASGNVEGEEVLLLKPVTFVNRSAAAVAPLREVEGFEVGRDLLVVVDDAMLDAAVVRFRASGSAGGHNGLKSIQGALGTEEYARLRVGVGRKPDGADLSDWVLSPMPAADEDAVVGRLPEITRGVECWIAEGIEAAMSRFNR